MGDYRPEHLFTLKQSLDGYRYYQKLIAELDDEIARLMHTCRTPRSILPHTKAHQTYRLSADGK